MKTFSFRLQSVLEHAREVEEDRQLVLSKICREKALIDERIQHTNRKREELLDAATRIQTDRFDARKMEECHLCIEQQGHILAVLKQESEQIERSVTAARLALLEAVKHRQMMEKLREKHLLLHRQAVEQYELKTMEEATIPRLARACQERTRLGETA